jgi:hypothetical protein
MRKDAIVGLACLLGSVLIYSTLGHIDEPRAVTFPKTIIIIMIILSALLLLQGLLVKSAEEKGPSYPWLRFLILFGLIVVYFAVSESLGFYTSAFLFFIAVTYILGKNDLTMKKAGLRALSSAIFTGVLFMLFSVMLEVQTPRGVLF